MKLWQYDELHFATREPNDWRFDRAVAQFEDLDEIKHLSTGSEYPDSPCGCGFPLVYTIGETSCPECLDSIIERGRCAAKRKANL